jgi:hypothetical protein
LPQDGVLEEPQTGETQTPTVEEEEPVPPCPEGQVLDEETGLCVLEEPETAVEEEEPEQPEPEESEQQEQTDDSEDNDNN